jgi:hypothetical protein
MRGIANHRFEGEAHVGSAGGDGRMLDGKMPVMEPQDAARGKANAGTPQPQAANDRESAIHLTPEQATRRVAPVRLTLEGWTGTRSALGLRAREWYAKNLQGKNVTNEDMGVRVIFSAEGKGESFGTSGNTRENWKAEIVRVLPDLVQRAVKVAESAPKDKRMRDTRMFYTLVAPLEANGRIRAVKITLREALHSPDPQHKFYDITALEIENGAMDGLKENRNDSPLPPSYAPFGISIGALVSAIKGNRQGHNEADGKTDTGSASASSRHDAGIGQETDTTRVESSNTKPEVLTFEQYAARNGLLDYMESATHNPLGRQYNETVITSFPAHFNITWKKSADELKEISNSH